ncbi:terminase small subunit [Serratia proteamaculans]|uniref:Terminase small subunit n=1 Tax=Serratia proteamaculans TaxID=28151 RepID=A0A7U0RM64_SERPR|nr:terminase small subunit [Serratia proteamaculans]MBO1505212.1 terminase small subunit [Serratia proteamaculans]MDW5511760.1 terminase small subunit [Serratia proteamaculans]QQX51798.1 terminase small subunit [Serratia proteamaculans]
MAKDGKLNAQMERFCQEYIKNPSNQTAAAAAAGYKNAAVSASRHMDNPKVQARIAELMEHRNKRVKIDADYVLKQSVKIHERCMQEIEPFTDAKGNHIHDDKGRPLYVFDAKAAIAALGLVGKHVNVQAFKERVDVNVNVTLADRMANARRRALEKNTK